MNKQKGSLSTIILSVVSILGLVAMGWWYFQWVKSDAQYNVGNKTEQNLSASFGDFTIPAGWIVTSDKPTPKGYPSVALSNYDYKERADRKEYAIPSKGGNLSIVEIPLVEGDTLEKFVERFVNSWLNLGNGDSGKIELVSKKEITIGDLSGIEVVLNFINKERPQIHHQVFIKISDRKILQFETDYRPDAPNKEKIEQDFSIVTSSFKGNQPIIKNISGPTRINPNETGIWVINATDSKNRPLKYTVNWGDGTVNSSGNVNTFTHAYSKNGIYSPAFIVSNDKGGENSERITINASPGGSKPSITVLSPKKGDTYIVGGSMPLRWNVLGDIPNTWSTDEVGIPSVVINLYKGGKLFKNIAPRFLGGTGGTIGFTTPDVPNGDDYRIQITASGTDNIEQKYFAFSEGSFSIIKKNLTQTQADLTVRNLKPLAKELTFDLCNDGAQEASLGVTDKIVPYQLAIDGKVVAEPVMLPIPPKTCITMGGAGGFPYSSFDMFSGQTYNVTVIVDPHNQILETNESNNSLTAVIVVPAH